MLLKFKKKSYKKKNKNPKSVLYLGTEVIFNNIKILMLKNLKCTSFKKKFLRSPL
jgi:hypothetical protein